MHERRNRNNNVTAKSHLSTIVLDFDGTITEEDLLDDMARRFGDPAVYQEVEDGIHAGTITLQECITREYAPVTMPLEDAVTWVLANVRVRAGLPELISLARARAWDVRVLSSGFEEVIGPVLADTGVEGVEIHANRIDARSDGWRVIWRDETVCEVCGEACKRSGLPDGDIIYVGDGISDRCAALAAQRIFATRGLARYLDDENVPFEPFVDFHDIVRALTD